MKNLFNINLLWLLCTVALLTTTSCENGTEEDIQIFPDIKTIECSAGDRPTFTFTTSKAWHLSSNALWCTFLSSAGEVQDISGNAGTHTITLRISDLDISSEPTEAYITMKVDEQQAAIVKVVRSAAQLYLRLYDVTDTPIDAIELGYVDYVPFRIEANFSFAAVEFPSWVEFSGGSVTGVAGEVTESMARIINDGEREKYPISVEDGYEVIFSDESGKHIFNIPITFKGMGNDKLTFVGPTDSTFGWEVSLDGCTFRQTNDATGVVTKFSNQLEYTITALNDDYEIICLEKVVDRGIPSYKDNAKWIHFDKESMSLSVDIATDTRYGLVLALPRAIYNQVRGDIDDNLFEMDNASGINLPTLRYSFLQYVLIEFTQRNFDEVDPYHGMYVYHSLTTYEIGCSVYTDEEVMASYDVAEAYSCPFPNPIDGKSPGIIIDPRIEGWDTDSCEQGTATTEFYYRGALLTNQTANYMIGENKEDVMAAHLYGLKVEFTDDVHILFKVNGQAKKLLVVTPPAM